MKNILLVLACAVLFSVVFAEDVVVGTTDNFDELIGRDNALVEFYAPWCGHCKKLEPEYAKAATLLKDEGITLVKVDATVESDLAQKYGVSGYPTIKWFRKGKVSADYDGERTADGIAAWCRKKSGPAATPIVNKQQFDKWLKASNNGKVVGFAASGSAEEKTFIGVAEDASVEEFGFAVVSDEALATELGAKIPSVVLHGADVKTFDGKIETEALIAWVLENGYPLLEELSQSVFKRASKAERALVVGFSSKDGKGSIDEQNAVFSQIATALKGKAMFSSSDAAKFPNLPSQWGASGTVYPTLTLVTWSGGQPKIRAFDEANEFSAESGTKWVDGCLSGGDCPAFKKSEKVPEKNDGPVKVVVGKTFEDIVFDTKADVLTEFYAPWCGHCKKLAPIYDELGAKFAKVPSVVIAKIDATANAYPDDIDVRGYPTILLFPANDKKNPISFEGNRDLEGLTKFLKENASIKFELEKDEL